MRKIKFTCAVIIGALISLFIRAPAVSVEAAESTSTLTYSAKAEGTIIDGAEITLYKIADIFTDSQGHQSYVLHNSYKSILENLTEEDMEKNVRDYAKKISDNAVDPYDTQTTDKSGSCTFRNLSQGVYLVKETNKSGTASSYDDFEPSILRIPEKNEDGSENHNILASVKIPPVKVSTPTPTSIPNPTPTKTPTPSDNPQPTKTPNPIKTPDSEPDKTPDDKTRIVTPKTGDDTPLFFYMGLAGASLVTLVIIKKRNNAK